LNQQEVEDRKQQLECGEADERGKVVQPGNGATGMLMSASRFFCLGRNQSN